MGLNCCIFATGESVNKEICDAAMDSEFDFRIAVNNAFTLSDKFEYLVAADRKWWDVYYSDVPKGIKKYSVCNPHTIDIEKLKGVYFQQGFNSALHACIFAVEYLKVKEIFLFGVDMGGSHFFGDYADGLNNTNQMRYDKFKEQFDTMKKSFFDPRGIKIYNCSEKSSLQTFEKMKWQV